MTLIDTKTEPFFQRHSWKVLLVISAIIGIFGIGDIIQGMNADPGIANSMTGIAWQDLQTSSPAIANLVDLQVRSGGSTLVALSILSIAICLTAYRRGEQWSWYAFWSYPLLMLLIFIIFLTANRQPDYPPPPPLLSAPIFFVISVLVLLLSYRKFFPITSKED
jgi:hypothetical protein